MPQSGPVYQPTTVAYGRPSLLSQTTASSTMKMLRRPMPQVCILILCLLSIAAGKWERDEHKGDRRESQNKSEFMQINRSTHFRTNLVSSSLLSIIVLMVWWMWRVVVGDRIVCKVWHLFNLFPLKSTESTCVELATWVTRHNKPAAVYVEDEWFIQSLLKCNLNSRHDILCCCYPLIHVGLSITIEVHRERNSNRWETNGWVVLIGNWFQVRYNILFGNISTRIISRFILREETTFIDFNFHSISI